MSRVLKTGQNQITWEFNGTTHFGIDLVKNYKQLDYIIAHSDGVVVEVVKNYNRTDTSGHSYGNYVKIKHNNGYYTLYAHMAFNSVKVNKGDTVAKGQVIGYMGNTGYAKGRHLHFEVRTPNNVRINPKPYIDADLPSETTETITDGIAYRVHLKNGSWLPWVNKVDDTNEGFAGILGKEIDGIQVKNKTYKAHTLNGSWLAEITDYNATNSNGYAGILNKSIDGLQVYNCQYRVHIKGEDWLPWVKKVDNTNDGYAGVYGKEIDGVQIKES
ncbi:MAG: M23 family metallopeptidase [Ruminococcus sp.]|nr:M23 family metallopeptidase [Ruminococcus sp.]